MEIVAANMSRLSKEKGRKFAIESMTVGGIS
jgi:hypothetical protein